MTNWGDWKITDEQAQAIYNGDKTARDKFYFDNLDKIRAMAHTHCSRSSSCRGWFEDMVNGVYVDLTIFESGINQPVNNVWRLHKFIYASFKACPRGGLAYLYEHNRKLLSGRKEYRVSTDILPLDAPISYSSALHNHDGGHSATIAEIIPTPHSLSEKRYDIIKQIVYRRLSPRASAYVGLLIDGYGAMAIKALTVGNRTTLSTVKKELITHYKTILDDLTAIGLNVEYYYKIDPNEKAEKHYKQTPEEREKRRLWAQNWRLKQKAKKNATPTLPPVA